LASTNVSATGKWVLSHLPDDRDVLVVAFRSDRGSVLLEVAHTTGGATDIGMRFLVATQSIQPEMLPLAVRQILRGEDLQVFLSHIEVAVAEARKAAGQPPSQQVGTHPSETPAYPYSAARSQDSENLSARETILSETYESAKAALGQGDIPAAAKLLSRLATMDPHYRDTQSLLVQLEQGLSNAEDAQDRQAAEQFLRRGVPSGGNEFVRKLSKRRSEEAAELGSGGDVAQICMAVAVLAGKPVKEVCSSHFDRSLIEQTLMQFGGVRFSATCYRDEEIAVLGRRMSSKLTACHDFGGEHAAVAIVHPFFGLLCLTSVGVYGSTRRADNSCLSRQSTPDKAVLREEYQEGSYLKYHDVMGIEGPGALAAMSTAYSSCP